MSRRRYISTDVSVDSRLNRLAAQNEFAALVYVFMIPHADDKGQLHGDVDELMAMVMPMRRDRTPQDFDLALTAVADWGLVVWDRQTHTVSFPVEAFYRHQTYVKAENRRESEPIADERRKTPQNAEEHCEVAENAVSFLSRSCSVSDPVSVPAPAPVPAQAREAATALLRHWERETGSLITPAFADWIDCEIEAGVPEDWLRDAISETGQQGVKSVKYTKAILDRWKRDGREGKPEESDPWASTRETVARINALKRAIT